MASARSGSLRGLLAEACASADVPGAAIAVLERGTIETAEVGARNVETGDPVTADTRFPIASIAKAYTATLVMELVEERRVALDEPARRYVPELRLDADSQPFVEAITVRHLLANMSGLPGYHFRDTGAGDDAIARQVETLETARLVHPPGERFAYSNPSFVVAGRIVERLRATTWDRAIEERLLRPLGLEETGLRPDQLDDAPMALGSVRDAAGGWTAAGWDPWSGVGRGCGPAGTSLFATVADMARFGRAHLGERWSAMRERQVAVPGPHAEGWGLGWATYGWNADVFGWDGVDVGIRTFLRILPRHGAVIALATNGNRGRQVYRTVLGALLAERFGTEIAPDRPSTLAAHLDPGILRGFSGEWACGRYVKSVRLADDGHLLISSGRRPSPGIEASDVALLPTADPSAFVLESPDADFPTVAFDRDFASIEWFGFRRVADP